MYEKAITVNFLAIFIYKIDDFSDKIKQTVLKEKSHDMLYSKNIEVKEICDLVVCGGGFSGLAAAYSAAREGLRVILVDRNGALGGVGVGGLVNHILGERYIENGRVKTCVGGLFSEIEAELLSMGGAVDVKDVDLKLPPHGWYADLGIGLIFDKEKMKLLLEKMLLDTGVKILYMTDIVDVVKKEDKLQGIVVHNKSGLYVIEGKYFVDATGDADICALADCKTLKGDDEGGMAAASLEMHLEQVDWEELTQYMRSTKDLRFRKLIDGLKEKGVWALPYDIFISVMLTGKDTFMINTIRQVGIDGTDADSISQGITDGRRENFKLLEIAKKYFPGFKNAKVREIAPVIGIRETRRIIGEYTLTVEDLISGKDFDDGIALSGYGWDLPNPKKPSHQPFHGVARRSYITQIPYGCLLPRGIGNLIAVGRCISVEREVLGPVRVMGPCVAMGEAAGIAASLAVKEKCSYNAIDRKALRETIIAHGGLVDRNMVKFYQGEKNAY